MGCGIGSKKIRGGSLIIVGTGIKVMEVAIRYEVMGMTPEDILLALPHLTLPQIHDALSYYYEHKSNLDKEWKASLKQVKALRKRHRSVLEEILEFL